jgi:regulator of sigma E protease
MDVVLLGAGSLLNFVSALLVLAVLIFVHELGHFLVAKWCGVGVVEFAIGFGKRLWSKRIGETLYSIRIIPLGGFVRMVGDDPRFSTIDESELHELSPEEREILQDKSRWFLTKSYLQRSSIVLAGPMFNFGFAIVLAVASVAIFGRVDSLKEPIIGEVIPGFPADRAGLRTGDVVQSVNGVAVTSWQEMADRIGNSSSANISISLVRDGKVENISVTADSEDTELAAIEGRAPEKRFKVGIVPAVKRTDVGFSDAIGDGVLQVYHISFMTLRGLWGMVSGVISAKNIGGPILILQQAAQSAQRGAQYVFSYMVLLSVSLAILNLLPIPILDGGHLLFFTIEAIFRTTLSVRVIERAQQLGMFILFALMLFAMFNDIGRLVG